MEIKSAKISGQGYAVDYGDGVIWSVSVDGCGYDKVLAWLADGNTPEPEFTEKEIEAQRIQAIKSKASELISSKYPDYKQLNIIRIGGAELETMSAYIDSIRKISNKAEQDGIKVEDVQWL